MTATASTTKVKNSSATSELEEKKGSSSTKKGEIIPTVTVEETGFDAELKSRMMAHAPTAKLTKSGLVLSEETLTKPDGRESKVKVFKAPTTEEDDIRNLEDLPHLKASLFGDLQHLNIILTNACNLSCTYCYEQHKKDYGRWDLQKLRKAYQFLKNTSQAPQKIFQFFGGEPLIHKQLILDFIRENKDELENDKQDIQFGLVTNGLLLDEDFMREYFSYKFTTMTLSLDTLNIEKDHRELKQEDIDHLLAMIDLIPAYHLAEKQVVIRCTLSKETAPEFPEFVDVLADHGVSNIIVHPLTMSNYQGQVDWTNDEWDAMQKDLFNSSDKYPAMEIRFSEGVGVKGASNCLVGSGMIALDASGDYSGCYFFTNIKEAAHSFVLGNIFDNSVYLNRYRNFQNQYNAMFENEECKDCHLKGFCYQCPAGNLDTGSKKIFRPDGMCKKIVTMYLNVQDRLTKKQFYKKTEAIASAIATEGRLVVLNRTMFHLVCKALTGYMPPLSVVSELENSNMLPNYKVSAAAFSKIGTEGFERSMGALNSLYKAAELISRIKQLAPIEMHQAYRDITVLNGFLDQAAQVFKAVDEETENWLISMMHLVVLNKTNHVEIRKANVNYSEL